MNLTSQSVNQSMNQWEIQFKNKMIHADLGDDPAHDFSHFDRVATTAKFLGFKENGKMEIIMPAAWLHDLINIPKNDPRRKIASQLSADAAIDFLKSIHYPEMWFEEIRHAIEAHSYSAKIEPKTLEAKIVQDADRLDSLGAIGIARCFTVGGKLNRKIYHSVDPLAKDREWDDLKYTFDHFFVKILKIGDTLLTSTGKNEGTKRIQMIKMFVEQFKAEIEVLEK